jgi:hypothetical protein
VFCVTLASTRLPEEGPVTEPGTPNLAWSDDEIDLVVTAYFELLRAELSGERPVKAAVIRELQRVVRRSHGSIEFKMGNVSAILEEQHEPWVDGYKPYHNYQRRLRDAVLERIGRDNRLSETLAEYQSNALPAPATSRRPTDEILVPPPSVERRTGHRAIGVTAGPVGAIRDLQNRRLGRAGEAFVLEAERLSLTRRGRSDLAERVRWVSDEDGDGAGYDIASFRPDGSDLHIEVKTTNLGIRTPFYITRWEVETSTREPELWSLYRVFDFRSDPRLFRLDGPVEKSARLEPSVFVGYPR